MFVLTSVKAPSLWVLPGMVTTSIELMGLHTVWCLASGATNVSSQSLILTGICQTLNYKPLNPLP